MESDFDPVNEVFFCEKLKRRMPYYDCKFEIENENPICNDCEAGNSILEAIKDYEEIVENIKRKPSKKRGRPKGTENKLTIIKDKVDKKSDLNGKEIKDLVPYAENALTVHIDFTKHSQLFGRIKDLAKRDFRDIDKQIMYMLSTWIDIDKKYEQAKRSVIAKGMMKLDGNPQA